MSNAQDPIRMLEREEPAFEELHGGLRDARRQGPSSQQRARLRAALGLPAGDMGAPLDAPKSNDPGASPAPMTTAASRVLKLVLAATLVTGAAMGGQHWLSSSLSARPPNPPPPVIDVGTEPNPASTLLAPQSTLVPAVSAPSHTVHEPTRLQAGAPAAPAKTRKRRVVEQQRLSSLSPPMAAPADPEGELELLRQARANARSGPERALQLIALHEQRYAHAAFAEEREVIAVEALFHVGRFEAANDRASRFFSQFPSSAHTRRLRALLETESATRSVSPPPSSR